jgi:CHASE2 domain-containing sensor protein
MIKLADRSGIRFLRAKFGGLFARTRARVLTWRFVRTAMAVLTILVSTWLLSKAGVLDRLDRVVSDIQTRVNPVPTDGTVVIVEINDADYWQIFGQSPLPADKVFNLVNDIARGGPSVIGVDIDTSANSFSNAVNNIQCECTIVWEREVEDIPETVDVNQVFKLLPILGGRGDLGAARTSSGIPILIDDPEDGTTRRYQRYFSTDNGSFPAFTTAVSLAYAQEKRETSLSSQLANFPNQEMLIRYSGDQQGSHRMMLTASKLHELSQAWKPDSSPIQGRIVLLGGSYLHEDVHKTPIGEINGVEVLANVIETELHGNAIKAPGQTITYLIELFEAFGLILMFHFWPFRKALVASIALIPAVSAVFSIYAYGDIAHIGHFFIVLLGLLFFEIYEHFRREQFPHLISQGKTGRHT